MDLGRFQCLQPDMQSDRIWPLRRRNSPSMFYHPYQSHRQQHNLSRLRLPHDVSMFWDHSLVHHPCKIVKG